MALAKSIGRIRVLGSEDWRSEFALAERMFPRDLRTTWLLRSSITSLLSPWKSLNSSNSAPKRYLPQFMAYPIPPQIQLEKTYNAAADHYDHPALSFWDRFGRRTVEHLPLAPGMEVLDVCCGMGGSALPAAERVGPSGHVVAVDLAQNLLDKGARLAVKRGLTNIEFRRGDLERLPFADQSFDTVICVFGIFFVPDLEGAVRGLWRLVRPGGYLAITIWGPKMFEPADAKFWEAVRQADPEL